MALALYPGSFDPVHNGHMAVISTAASLFDRLVVGVAANSKKPGWLPVARRVELLNQSCAHLSGVDAMSYTGLTVDTAKSLGASCLVKGVRNTADFDDEIAQAAMNQATGGVATVFIPGFGSHGLLTSRYIREFAASGVDIAATVPSAVADYLLAAQQAKANDNG